MKLVYIPKTTEFEILVHVTPPSFVLKTRPPSPAMTPIRLLAMATQYKVLLPVKTVVEVSQVVPPLVV